MATLLLFLLARPLAVRLPRPVLSALGVLAGAIAYSCASRARAAVRRNLSVVLPELDERARRRLTVATFIHGAWSYLELLALSKSSVQLTGREHLEDALARGRGVLLVTAHLGAPLVAGRLLAAEGFRSTVVVEPLRPPALHRWMVRLRSQAGLRQVALGPTALRELVAALRRNEIVTILCDRDVAGSGRVLPFFRRATRVTTAPASLSLRTGTAVLPAVAYRAGPFRAAARIEPPLELPRSHDTARDVREGTLAIMARIESFIHEHPEQWVVFQDIWPAHE